MAQAAQEALAESVGLEFYSPSGFLVCGTSGRAAKRKHQIFVSALFGEETYTVAEEVSLPLPQPPVKVLRTFEHLWKRSFGL